MTKYFPTQTIATLVSGRMMLPKGVHFYSGCADLFDWLTQDKQTNAAFFNRGAVWCQSVLAEQYPEFINLDCGRGREAVDKFVAELEAQYGTELPVQPADRPFLKLELIEEWPNAKGISIDEAKKSSFIV